MASPLLFFASVVNRLRTWRKRQETRTQRSGSRQEDLTAKQVYQVAKKRRIPTLAQWLELPTFLSLKERLLVRAVTATALLAIVVFTSVFYFSHRVIVPTNGGEYTEGIVGEPRFVNPLYSSVSTVDMDLTRLVFRGLFIYDPEIGITPDLTERYETSEDGRTYTIHLREGVKWHDGEPLTAHDVAFTFQAITDPAYRSPLAGTFHNVTVEAIDDLTVQFSLPESFASFLPSLTVGIVPSHIWESVSPQRASLTTLNLQPIGNGPYQFEKFSKDQTGVIRSYTLKRFNEYFGTPAHIDTLTFKFYPDADSALSALENRNIEGVAFVPEDRSQDMVDNRFVQLLRPSIPQETLIFFNENRNTRLASVDVREALSISLNLNDLVTTVFHDNARILTGPLLPRTLVEETEIPAQDVSRAFDLFTKAGWTRNPATQILEKKGSGDELEQFEIALSVLDTPDMLAIAEWLKSQWEPLGVVLTIRPTSSTIFQTDVIKPRAYDLLLTGILFNADEDPFSFWHSSQIADPGVNLSGYSNRNVDTALETARTSTDVDARDKALQTIQDTILKDRPAIFLVQPTYPYAVASRIQGITLSHIVTPADRFNRVSDWYIRTKKAFRTAEE